MNLESDKRLNIQLRLDFSSTPTGEARQARREDIESLSVASEPERPRVLMRRLPRLERAFDARGIAGEGFDLFNSMTTNWNSVESAAGHIGKRPSTRWTGVRCRAVMALCAPFESLGDLT